MRQCRPRRAIREEEVDMKHAFSNAHLELLALFTLTSINPPMIGAEARCPGNIASVTPRFVQGALIIIPVRINHRGPFDFMMDTGSQVTVIDPSLASELGLKPQGEVGLVSATNYTHGSVATLESLEVDSHTVEKPLVIVQELGQIRAAVPRIRGVLGENFLAHFDLLIDYRHKVVCLDATKTLAGFVHGEHIPLIAPQHPESELPYMERLVISARLSGAGPREILLQVDSGSDGPILFPYPKRLELRRLERAALRTSGANQAFAAVAPQDMRIGGHIVSNISFVTPVRLGQRLPAPEEDGLLPTVLFQSVFISHANRYVIFELR
jgi:Aspartyl protease